jgi:hypothetical protein
MQRWRGLSVAGRAAVIALLIFLGLGTVAVASAAAAEPAPAIAAPTDLPSFWWRDGIVRTDAGSQIYVWRDRRTDSFMCSWAGRGCIQEVTRRTTPDDQPVHRLRDMERVTVECYKGTYFMVRTDAARLGWVPRQLIDVGRAFVQKCDVQD